MKTPQRYCELGALSFAIDELREIRQQIHQNPELAYEELETAALVASRLASWGYLFQKNAENTIPQHTSARSRSSLCVVVR